MNRFKQGALGWLIYGGAAMFFVCGLGTWFLSVALALGGSSPGFDALLMIGVVLAVSGPLMAIGGLTYGLMTAKTQHRGPRKSVSVKVVARYALDRSGVLHTDEHSIAHLEHVRFYVRLFTGEPECDEYECVEPTFWQAGEGMWGLAEIQGRWLGKFVPSIGPEQGRQDDTVARL